LLEKFKKDIGFYDEENELAFKGINTNVEWKK